MTNQVVEVRLQLLKDVGAGLSKVETVQHLRDKFGISRSGAYYHFDTRDKWLGQYCGLANAKDLQFQIFQHYTHIYRESSFQYLHCQDHNARIGYLRTMLEAAKALQSFLPESSKSTPNNIALSWEDQPYLNPDDLTPEEKQTLLEAERILHIKMKTNRDRESMH